MGRINKSVKLNIGCGPIWEWKHPDCDGVDLQDFGQKYVCNALDLLDHINEDTVDEIVMNHFLEHLDNEDAVKMLNVCWELLKMGRLVEIEVPHFTRSTAWMFPHKSHYSKAAFKSLEYEEYCNEIDSKPWKVESIHVNGKKNLYCTLKKAKSYMNKARDAQNRETKLYDE